jgi:hypothetical protein
VLLVRPFFGLQCQARSNGAGGKELVAPGFAANIATAAIEQFGLVRLHVRTGPYFRAYREVL